MLSAYAAASSEKIAAPRVRPSCELTDEQPTPLRNPLLKKLGSMPKSSSTSGLDSLGIASRASTRTSSRACPPAPGQRRGHPVTYLPPRGVRPALAGSALQQCAACCSSCPPLIITLCTLFFVLASIARPGHIAQSSAWCRRKPLHRRADRQISAQQL